MPTGQLLRIGDKTTCGGSILSGFHNHSLGGIPTARNGDSVSCGKDGKIYYIAGGIPNYIIHGVAAAGTLHSRSTCPCKAKFISSYPNATYWAEEEKATKAVPAPQSAKPEQHAAQKLAASTPANVPAQNAYWPPYDFAQGKSIEVVYTAPPVDLAVLSLEEADEFLSNLYEEMGGKDNVSDLKSKKDLAAGLYSAAKTAHGLGGLGVQSRIKNINGVDWVIINNFRRHKQTLMKGNKWLASNPKVVQSLIGITSLKGAKTYVKGNPGVEVAFSIGINAADYILRDEATLIEFGVNSAGDMAKGFAATVVAGGLAVALSGGSILAAGAIFAFASWGMSKIFDMTEEEFGISKKITKEFERLAQ